MNYDLYDRLLLQADLAKHAKGTKARDRLHKRLICTVSEIVHPKLDGRRLRDALNYACVKHPDFGDAVVFESNKGLAKIISDGVLHLDGSFDIALLNEKLNEKQWRDL